MPFSFSLTSRPWPALLTGTVLAASLAACGDTAILSPEQGMGKSPTLPAPNQSLIPTLHIAPAKGWPEGSMPTASLPGLSVTPLATGLDHPRWVLVLPNGDVLVAESQAPPKGEGAPSGGVLGAIKGWVMKTVMGKAGSGKRPSANRITLLRDADGDGRAETQSVFLQNLNSPFGMALVGNELYVANADAVVRFPYEAGQTSITAPGTKLVDLPGGPINHHWTKNLIASADGSKLYVTVGSNSNVGENGMQAEEGRAAIWEVDRASGSHRIFASGLRNPNGLGWAPGTGALWTVVNERDEIGSDLVPDYLTSVKDGAFYGWPYSYYGQHVDERVQPPRPDLVAKAVSPDYALGSHVAPLGMAFSQGPALAPQLASGAFVGEHGSWNRKPRSGYKVVFVPFVDGQPSGLPIDVLAGFVSPDGDAYGRPVGVAVDARGGLLVADDVGNAVWRVGAAAPR
ncbi:sorbosone dehydrogenase family protein [Acidovorax sp. Root217]|uniref:PQQ-dependent sugar dehydrogenase n=1 Tax=Acidovorax sp. Root217 TaxID=1736492 RepID=UPI00070F3FAC|nr:sorbosone dehydrogenase family protein [Acidovorax sp. Root217]KRC20860.1 sorbosone dehydrogenase [Acidovorax sp. Root217]